MGYVLAGDTNVPPSKRQEAVFAEIKDIPKLLRVLVIGDSISIGYTEPLRLQLQDKFNIHRVPANCGSTRVGLSNLDSWLGRKKWDVIHFNFGLHDMAIVWPDGKVVNSQGVYATLQNGGKPNVPPAEYEKNLREIVARLKKTGARLVWASTTAVPAGLRSYSKGAEITYNEIAERVMREEVVTIDDLWKFTKPQLSRIQLPGNPHFTAMGYRMIAWQVAQSIQHAAVKGANQTLPAPTPPQPRP